MATAQLTGLEAISGRAIVPLVPSDPEYAYRPRYELPDPRNVQGDIYLLLPKNHENFIFFAIKDVAQFKKDLATYNPTSSEDVIENLKKIAAAKANASDPSNVQRVELWQTQIAFSRAGMDLLGHTEKVNDIHFDQGSMRNEIKELGDGGPWYEPFKSETIYGVIVIAASHENACQNGTQIMKDKFQASITLTASSEVDGNARPGAERGHEHFGFKDSVSQPALRGLVKPHTGQLQADPGVVIMGYQGDPFLGQRPSWTKDGTLMVFRKLEQDVVGFEKYIKDAGPKWRQFMPANGVNNIQPPLADSEGAELFGARLMGRWKSGAPLANAPYRDDPSLAADPNKVNDFDYSVKGVDYPTDQSCPFTAHVRKTAPRNLDPFIDKLTLDKALTIRAGLAYGPEVTDAERQQNPPSPTSNRGLLFVCYQSSTTNGFWQQTKNAVDNSFPPVSFSPQFLGQDPIIGGAPGPPPPSAVIAPQYFVTSRGGEYFFVPSVPTLRSFADPAGGTSTGPPTSPGVYRIRLLHHSPPLYWDLIPGGNAWVKLCPLDASSNSQKWKIVPTGGAHYEITSVYDNSGLIASKTGYWGYGYPIPSPQGSDTWVMCEYTVGNDKFTKINVTGSPNVLDSYNNEVVHFYYINDTAENQKWVFERV